MKKVRAGRVFASVLPLWLSRGSILTALCVGGLCEHGCSSRVYVIGACDLLASYVVREVVRIAILYRAEIGKHASRLGDG